MENFNPNLLSEISIVLIADEIEFLVERAIINEVIYPALRKYFMAEFQLEFNVVDLYQDKNCKFVPVEERANFLISELKRSQRLSSGLSTFIMLGERCGELNVPKILKNDQFNYVLNYLQSKKDPSWKIFSSRYTKSKISDEYILEENVTRDEIFSILNGIDGSISTKHNDIFPETFIKDNLTTFLEKSLELACIDRASISSTQIIRRITTNNNAMENVKEGDDNNFQKKLKEKYEFLIRTTKKKCLSNNFTEYSVNNTILLKAQREICQNKNKLAEISDSLNFISGKSRLLSKDLRLNSTSDMYLQIFLEHVCKIIRENCVTLLYKKEVPKDILSIESLSHVMKKVKIDNEVLISILEKEREREHGIFQNYLNSNTAKMPALIFGPIGSGKTIFLLDLIEKIERKTDMILIIRHCGKTVSSSNLQLLITSISDQINATTNKKTDENNPCEYAVCVYDFWMSLNQTGSSRSIVILLDDVENLFPTSHTDMVKWLPPTLPNGVKIILTSSSSSFYQGFKKRYEVSNIINLNKIDSKECIRILPTLMNKNEQLATPDSLFNQANFCLQENSTPLFLQIISQTIDFVKDVDQLTTDINSLFKIYVEKCESKTNSIILKHMLSYVALSRFGLSLSELTDILSLDNKILSILDLNIKVKSSFRFPISLTLYYLGKCQNIIMPIQTGGKTLIILKHQVFISSITEYYQLFQEEGKFFYQTLYDYWTSKYSGDKFKPIFDKASEDDETIPTEGSHLYIKRSISSQPYYRKHKDGHIISNQRKLLELPYLLIKFDKISELYKLVVFNFEYLFSMLYHFGINHLISELYFTRQLNEIKNNTELELLLAQLRLLSTEVIKDAMLLAPELTGRLCHLVGSNTLISQLHQQIDTNGTKINVLSAAIPCYPTIDIENMRIDFGLNKELMFSTLSSDNRFISTLIKDNVTKNLFIFIWDSRSATKSQIINLGKFVNTKFINMFSMPQGDDFVILQYEDNVNCGFLTVNLEFSSIESTIKFPKSSLIKVENLSKSHLYLTVNGEHQIYTHPKGEKDINLSKELWPFQMTPNDRYFIGPKPISKKATDTGKSIFNLRVLNTGTWEILCQLSMNMSTSCMFANVRNETLFIGIKTHGIIFRFDIGQIAKKDAKSLKNNLELKINDQSLDSEMNEHMKRFYPNVRVVKFQLSIDERFLISEYILNDSIMSFAVWNIINKSLVQCKVMEVNSKVAFSTDGQYVYYYQRNGTLNIMNLTNGANHNLILKDVPEHIYMLKNGSFFMCFLRSVKLTTLKTLLQDSQSQDNTKSFRQENFSTSLSKPKINSENAIIYSNYEETSTFLYFKLSQNIINSIDISHTNKSLTYFSTDRFLSPNGEKLLLVFGFKLANLMITDQVQDLDILTLKTGINGQIISNLNDYRKPQMPKENYFTGKYFDSIKKNSNKAAYEQKIIKIIELKTKDVIFQVSLTGEQILNFTDTLLITFKPDYASLTRNLENGFDILSIYDVVEGQFLSSLYLEHPVVDSAIFPNNKELLLICCGFGGKFLKLLGGLHFSTTLYEINTQTLLRYYDEFARSSIITKIFTFPENANGLLLQYSWLDSNGTVKVEKETYYATIDTVKKEIISQFSSLGKVTNVSRNGFLAVDSLLNTYDLHKGNVCQNFQASIGRTVDLNNFSCTSLFSKDSNHIVTLDSVNNTILVIKNDETGLIVGKALLTSSFEDCGSSSPFKMELALGGQIVIVYNDSEFKIFVMKIFSKSLPLELNYKSNIERIKKILLP